VAVWVGYDNADGKRRTLGGGATGGHTAVPIFEPIMQAVWAHVAPKTALAPPSPEARRLLTCKAVDAETGKARERGRSLTECFRVDGKGRVADTQYRLISRESAYAGADGPAPRRERMRERRPARYYHAAPAPHGFGWGWQNGSWYQQDQSRRGGHQRFWNPW
jgi:membrane carboxypeptidase/penicillin-binding protein